MLFSLDNKCKNVTCQNEINIQTIKAEEDANFASDISFTVSMWWFLWAGVSCPIYCDVPVDVVWNYKIFFIGKKRKRKREK